jgi:hypothetical protein
MATKITGHPYLQSQDEVDGNNITTYGSNCRTHRARITCSHKTQQAWIHSREKNTAVTALLF